MTAPQPAPPVDVARDRLVRHLLTVAGFSESATFAFVEKEASVPFSEPGVEATPIANPLSEKFAVLRPSLLPGLLDASVHNRRRERKDIQLFETGSRFTSHGEGRAAAFVWSGAADGSHWSQPTRAVDFFDVKGVVEQIAAAFGIETEFAPAAVGFLAPGRSAEVRAHRNGTRAMLGVVGQIAPAIAAARGFPRAEELFAAELDPRRSRPWRPAASARRTAAALSLHRPRISILIEDTLPAATVLALSVRRPSTLVSIAEFDRYQGKEVRKAA